MAAPCPVGHLSVQAIKGRFEKMQDVSYSSGPFAPPRATPPCRRRRSPFSPVDPGPGKDSPFLPDEEVVDEKSDNTRGAEFPREEPRPVEPSPRPRSRSVGATTAISQQNRKNSGGLIPLQKTVSGHRYPFSSKLNGSNGTSPDVATGDAFRFPSSDNFTSFTEKQKLVESIVLNIKNSAAMERKRKEEEQKNKDFKAKDILSSKFEKNLKNVLERGVRRKWNEKAIREDSKHFRENFHPENLELDLNILKQKQKQILNSNTDGSNRQKSFSKINSILGVELYPTETSNRGDSSVKDSHESKKTHNSENSLPMLSESNRRTKEDSPFEEPRHPPHNSHCEETTTSHSLELPAQIFAEEKACQSIQSESKLISSATAKTEKIEPVRPPRRRRGKKGIAPQPPSSPFGELQDKSFSFGGRDDQEQPSPVKEDSEGVTEKLEMSNLATEEYKSKECDDSAFFSMSYESSSYDVDTRDFNYEDNCERNLENDVFADKDSKSLDGVFGDSLPNVSDKKEGNGEQPFNSCRGISLSEPSLDMNSLPCGAPPKKPPRTFAYDIYRVLKPCEVDEEDQLTASTPKLTPMEIESLYTKPLKRVTEKPPSPTEKRISVSSKSTADLSTTTKPAIAPKPLDIISRAKQRLSVSEPLPSAAESKEFSACKPSVKRNSSFRFSFRKHKKSSNSPPRQIALKTDNQMGKKIRGVARNLHPRKGDKEKKVRFQSGCNSKVIYDDVEGGPIYAVPNSNETKPSEGPQELHYMCSPLFQNNPKTTKFAEDDANGPLKENCPPSPLRAEIRDRLRIVDGFKEDFRQSCRLMQKRLKGTASVARHHHR